MENRRLKNEMNRNVSIFFGVFEILGFQCKFNNCFPNHVLLQKPKMFDLDIDGRSQTCRYGKEVSWNIGANQIYKQFLELLDYQDSDAKKTWMKNQSNITLQAGTFHLIPLVELIQVSRRNMRKKSEPIALSWFFGLSGFLGKYQISKSVFFQSNSPLQHQSFRLTPSWKESNLQTENHVNSNLKMNQTPSTS